MGIATASPWVVALIAPSLFAQDWVLRQTPTTPPAVYGARMVYDALRGEMVMFGGLYWTQGQWQPPQALAQTWVLAGANWTQRTTAAAPPARAHHAMAWNSQRHVVVLFGGIDGNGSPMNDLWEYDGTNWSHTYQSFAPASRGYPAMAFDGSYMVVFGGWSPPFTYFGDTWRWASAIEGWQFVSNTGPSPRRASGMASTSTGVVLHGGRTLSQPQLGDTWLLTQNGSVWAAVPNAGGPLREEMAMAHDPRSQQVFLACGHYAPTQSGFANDLWRFDGVRWREMQTATRPAEVIGPAGALDTARDRFVMFGGGRMSLSFPSAQLWEFGSTFPVTRFGTSCAPAGPLPTLAIVDPAAIGSTWHLRVQGVQSIDFAVMALGFDDAVWNGTPLPASLASYGLPCHAWIAPEASFLLPAWSPNNPAPLWSLPIPDAPVLLGMELFAQALVGNTFGLRGVSDAVRSVIY